MDAQGRSRTPCTRRCTQVSADGAEASILASVETLDEGSLFVRLLF